jgi:hypothetical protein
MPTRPKVHEVKESGDTEAEQLADRAKRLKPVRRPLPLDSRTSAVQFLRGLSSRAVLTLPALYLLVGASTKEGPSRLVPAYPGIVLAHWVRFASLNTITLTCRKAFDHAASGLTGNAFSKTSDAVLHGVAKYWSDKSGLPIDDAHSALVLLRTMFGSCSKTSSVLLEGASTLGKRVGLLKQHADRAAAHLTLETYEFSIPDCAHVVGAITLIGEIIRAFDNVAAGPNYFNAIDEAAFTAARTVFPDTPALRLFEGIDIAQQAHSCWKYNRGEQMLHEQLPYATGWW